MTRVQNIFGSCVFNDVVMKERLPKHTYKALQNTIYSNTPLTIEDANVIASEMKNWALEKGATHFTHWFQPMTGITAEKHDSFISPVGNGSIIMEFSGKELIKGEPDASSFPSGGIRATVEARGYTNWDPTSPAFIKEKTLCIPTAFCSYGGEALDKKTPLLRSMEALSKQAVELIHIMGYNDVKKVFPTVGAEQEYFLIDEKLYHCRKDLMYCGRTLFGAKPPKRQELEDHYFGAIKPRVKGFMEELNEELWSLGVLSKTEHNEVSPAQHEMAPVFSTANIATDHNQLVMEMMKKVAKRHGLVCLLHEKPFAGVNGSGKHNNWSLSTDTGKNILDPGKNPSGNMLFLVFLAAIVQAIDNYQALLRVSVASPGNDHRLGGSEAPPAIISIFLGEELGSIVDAIICGKKYIWEARPDMDLGVIALPNFQRDTTDRNRTSPFAFTGNKFEFRMPGSSDSIACCNYIINTIIAESLSQFIDVLKNSRDVDVAIRALIKDTFTKHQRILFNGDNYTNEWLEESGKRGLYNLKSTVEAVPYFIHKESLDVLQKHGVFSPVEIKARYEITLDEYSKLLNIEAMTMISMADKEIYPSVLSYCGDLAKIAIAKKELDVDYSVEKDKLDKLSGLNSLLVKRITALEDALLRADEIEGVLELAQYFRNVVFIKMGELREVADELETRTAEKYWPFPTYGDLLFNI